MKYKYEIHSSHGNVDDRERLKEVKRFIKQIEGCRLLTSNIGVFEIKITKPREKEKK